MMDGIVIGTEKRAGERTLDEIELAFMKAQESDGGFKDPHQMAILAKILYETGMIVPVMTGFGRFVGNGAIFLMLDEDVGCMSVMAQCGLRNLQAFARGIVKDGRPPCCDIDADSVDMTRCSVLQEVWSEIPHPDGIFEGIWSHASEFSLECSLSDKPTDGYAMLNGVRHDYRAHIVETGGGKRFMIHELLLETARRWVRPDGYMWGPGDNGPTLICMRDGEIVGIVSASRQPNGTPWMD